MVSEKDYNLVLMDVQMPVMDGETATREIRKDERFADLPILAMTASVMTTDIERCMESGMNDHVAKPIEPDNLFGKLLKWISPRQGAGTTESQQAPEQSVDVPAGEDQDGPPSTDSLESVAGLDVKAGLSRVLNKRDLYERMLRQFVTGAEADTVATVRTQLADNDRESAERTAHTLKGVAGTLGATELQARAGELERGIREEDPEDRIDAYMASVDQELSRLIPAIQEALPEEKAAEAVEAGDVDWDEAKEVVGRLEDLLEQEDAAAIDVFEECAPLLRAALGEAAASIETPLTGWDFAAALEALRQARAKRSEL
jgi:CheY-like chemotaxis protein